MTSLPTEMELPEQPPKKKKKKRAWLIILLALLAAVAVLIGTFAWLYYQGRQALTGNGGMTDIPFPSVSDATENIEDDWVLYDGTYYEYNENVTPILVIGVDKEDIQEDGAYGQNGQADTIFLAALDTVSGALHIVPISREVMVDVNQYAVDGSYVGVKNTQLCLAYAYAADGDEACRNVARSVSRLLYGLPIENYVAMDMNGIKAVTDAVGGVSLTPLVTVKNWWGDEVAQKGVPTTLNGKNALLYLRHRGADSEGNNRRMQQQKQFFTALLAKIGSKLQENVGRLPEYYKTVSPYVVTNINLSKTTYLAGCALTGGGFQTPVYHSITGTSVEGEKSTEFHADPNSVFETVLKVFYSPVER